MYTVRDLMAKDYEGTFAEGGRDRLQGSGARIQWVGYMEPKQFRAMLDRSG